MPFHEGFFPIPPTPLPHGREWATVTRCLGNCVTVTRCLELSLQLWATVTPCFRLKEWATMGRCWGLGFPA